PSREIAGIAEINRKAGAAELLGQLQGSRLARLSDRYQRDRSPRQRRLGDKHGKPLDARGPADSRSCRPTHHLEQAIITASANYCPLSSQIRGDELKGRVAVIVETAHQPRIQAKWYP